MVFLPVKNSNKIEDNRARQICPKIPSISSYQGKIACQSIVIPKRISNMKQLKLFRNDKEPEKALSDWPKDVVSKSQKNKKRKRFKSKEEYYKSEEWKKIRIFALHRAKHRCQRCGASGVLQVHHSTYSNLYNEKPEDLEVLCKKCHKKADREREYDSWYDSALDTYMTKKYGENWDYFDGYEEEFDDWLERK